MPISPHSLESNRLRNLLDVFYDEVPAILADEPQTAKLASDLEAYNKVSALPFTVAVVGQMRSGKSSLINALIGSPLAPVGVDETTATINYFKYADQPGSPSFRVHWHEKPPEILPISEIDRWCGASSLARETRYIEFFAHAKLLRGFIIADTPGTRSVIGSHNISIDNFMSQKMEKETLSCGGKADAIIYIIGPVARSADRTFLDDFRDQTNSLNSSPFNSIALVHKWETVETEDPVGVALQKADRIYRQLSDYVSAVLPVSAPLIRISEKGSETFWALLAERFGDMKPRLRERVIALGNESRLKNKIPDLYKLYHEAQLPWASFRAIYFIASRNDFPDGPRLRALVSEAGGKHRLIELLNSRFVERTRLIKSFTQIDKAIKTTSEAQIRLKNHMARMDEFIGLIERASKKLTPLFIRGFRETEDAVTAMETAKNHFVSQKDSAESTLRKLDAHTHDIRVHFEVLYEDVSKLAMLDERDTGFTDDELLELRTLLGCYGQSVEERLSCYKPCTNSLMETIDSRISHWMARKERTFGSLSDLLDQVINRLEILADTIEGK